jgi:hypothetical protein
VQVDIDEETLQKIAETTGQVLSARPTPRACARSTPRSTAARRRPSRRRSSTTIASCTRGSSCPRSASCWPRWAGETVLRKLP